MAETELSSLIHTQTIEIVLGDAANDTNLSSLATVRSSNDVQEDAIICSPPHPVCDEDHPVYVTGSRIDLLTGFLVQHIFKFLQFPNLILLGTVNRRFRILSVIVQLMCTVLPYFCRISTSCGALSEAELVI
jgi:hypothetical protein